MADVLDFEVRVKMVEGDINKINSQLNKMKTDIEKSGNSIDSQFEKIGKSAMKMAAAIGAGLSLKSLVKEIYDYANAFDQASATIATISSEVQGNIDGYKQQMLGLTTEIPIAADEAAKALYQIVSAGHDGADGMEVLEVAAKAAIGGVTDTATAADAITTLLNAYKLSAADAEKISDQLFTTAKLGKTTFGELGQHIAQAAPIAASFGIETEQLTAAIATLTKSGVPTAQAMTQIRASIMAASKVLGDGYFATHTFQEGLQQIAEMAGGSESKLRELVPEIEAMNGILGLTGINAEAAASDLEKMGASAGATGEAFSVMAETGQQQLLLLKNNIMSALYGLGEDMVNSLGNIAKVINGMFDDGTIKIFTAALKAAVAAFGAYKATVMVANAAQKAHMKILKSAIVIKRANAAAGITMSNAEAIAAAKTNILVAAQRKLNLAMKANPWGLALAAVTALGVAMYELFSSMKDTEEAQTALNKSRAKAMENYNQEAATIDALVATLHDENASYDRKKDALDRLNEIIPEYNGQLDEEGRLIKQNEQAMKDYLVQLEKSYRVKAAEEDQVEIFKKKRQLEKEIEKKEQDVQQAQKDYDDAKYGKAVPGVGAEDMGSYTMERIKDLNKAKKDLEKSKREKDQLDRDIMELQEEINSNTTPVAKKTTTQTKPNSTYHPTKTKKEREEATNYAEKAAREASRMEESNYDQKMNNEAEIFRQKTKDLNELYDKEQELIDKEYQHSVEAIEKERDEALKNAKGEDKAKINEAYNRQIAAQEEEWRMKTEKNERTRDAAIYGDRLELYKKYVEEYIGIAEEAADREKTIREAEKQGDITHEEANNRVEASAALADIDKETLMAQLGLTAEEVSTMLGDVVAQTLAMGIDEIALQLPTLEAELKRLKDSGADPQKIAKVTAAIKAMKIALRQAKTATTQTNNTLDSGALTTKEKLSVAADALYTLDHAISDVGSAFGDMFSEGGQVAMQIMQSVLSASTAIIGSLMAVSTTAIAQMSALEKASVILTIISVAVQIITAITNALVSHYSAHAKYNKAMDESKLRIKELRNEQEEFDHELEKKSGSEYWKSYAEGAKYAKSQIEEIKGAIEDARIEEERAAEAGKKKQAAQAKEDRLELEKEQRDAEKDLLETNKQLLEEFATTSLQSFSQSMADSMVEGFSNGMNGIKDSYEETIKDLQKSMLTRQLALALEDQFKGAFDQLSKYTSDGELTNSEMESFYEMMEQGSANAEIIGEKYREMMARLGLLDDADIEAESKGFQTLTQDQGDELNGRFTALQISGANIEAKMNEELELDKASFALTQSIRDNVDLITNLAADQLSELKEIRENTAKIAETNIRLKKIEENTGRI